MIDVSICIATWNRKEDLRNIVLLLEKQTIDKKRYEIIVVDSCSPDGTGIEIRKLQEVYSNIVYIEDADNILASKRNRGIKAAKGKIIVFMDDDVYPTERFIEAHYLANIQNRNTFFCGQIRFREDLTSKSNYYFFRDRQHLDEKDKAVSLPFNKIVVMNLSFRKEYIEKVGLVNEKFIGYGGEDMEFGFRVKNAGYDLKYLPEALAYHDEKSGTIIEYGVKLYKSGLYGLRILKEECPEAYLYLTRRYKLAKKVLSIDVIKRGIGRYLLETDKERNKYKYIFYKMYLYACMAQGERQQKNFASLSVRDAKKGW